MGFAPLGGARGPAGTTGGDACCTVPDASADAEAPTGTSDGAPFAVRFDDLDQLGCCSGEEGER